MKVAVLYSGGKDSTFAVWSVMKEGMEIVSLITFKPDNPDSYMFHHPNILYTKIQAESMDIPIKVIPTKGEKEKELRDLENAIKGLDIDAVVAGALASVYQKSRIEKICKKLGLELVSPAWGINPEDYWNILFNDGFRVIITKVACDGLGKEWLGKELTAENFQELKKLSEKYKFHLGFEGGEAETMVVDCPIFTKSVHILDSKIEWKGDSGVFIIKKAILTQK